MTATNYFFGLWNMNTQPSSQTVEFDVKGHTVLLDAEDVHLLKGRSWHLSEGHPRTSYTYFENDKKRFKFKYLHSLIVEHHKLNNKKSKVVHRDNNKLNCTKANLQIGTQTNVMLKSGLRSNNKTGYKGVYRMKGKYAAAFNRKHLGLFNTPEEAALAYNREVIKLGKGEAYLNPV